MRGFSEHVLAMQCSRVVSCGPCGFLLSICSHFALSPVLSPRGAERTNAGSCNPLGAVSGGTFGIRVTHATFWPSLRKHRKRSWKTDRGLELGALPSQASFPSSARTPCCSASQCATWAQPSLYNQHLQGHCTWVWSKNWPLLCR